MIRQVTLVMLAVMLAATFVAGQSTDSSGSRIAVPVPPPAPRPVPGHQIKQVELDATIRDQVAQVNVTHVFYNPTRAVIEAEYLFPLPETGAVQEMVLLVDGKEWPGRILPKDEARRIYESIVRQQRDPALLEYMGRGLFRTSVFPIPPGQTRTVTLRSTFVCHRDEDVVQFAFPLVAHGHATRPIEKLRVTVDIHSSDAIKAVYSPSHAITTQRLSDHHARVQHEQQNVAPHGDFRLFYTLADGIVGARVLSYRPNKDQDGFFMLLASPQVRQADEADKPISKTVIFAIDRSGSMRGRKMEQARNAATFVLANLNTDDLFNIVVYDGSVETFRPELERLTPQTRAEAMDYVANLRAGGLTNIDGAMQTALAMLEPGGGPAYVLFMTDGMPTTGVTDEMQIAKNTETRNRAGARIFSFGVGHDVNARLLDRISNAHGGTTEYVGPDDDLEVAMARFYGKMTAPVLTDIDVAVKPTAINRAYPQRLPDLFAGGQILWVGRYTQSGPTTFTLAGKVGDQQQTMTVETRLAEAGEGQTFAFVERIWAQRRIAAIVSQMDLHGRSNELLDELVELSRRYGILTPYTSFLADETAAPDPLVSTERLRPQAAEQAEMLRETSGSRGFGQRAYNQALADADTAASPAAPLTAAPGRVAQPTDVYRVDADNRRERVSTMRQVAGQNFIQRNGQWVQATVTPEEVEQAEVVARFSDRYFEMAMSADGRMLAQDGELVLRLAGNVYRIVDQP